MTSIVVAAPPFTGEMQPLLQIAGGLASRGHDVTMLTGSRFDQQVRAAGVGFVALQGDADFDDRRLAEHRPAIARAAPGPDQLNALFGAAADALPTEHRQVQALLDADPDAVLITNSVLLGPWAVALGAPGRRPRRWIAVGCNPLALPSEDTTPLGPMPAGPDGDARGANRAVNAQFAEMTEPARARIESALRSLGATDPVPGIFDGVVTVPEVFALLGPLGPTAHGTKVAGRNAQEPRAAQPSAASNGCNPRSAADSAARAASRRPATARYAGSVAGSATSGQTVASTRSSATVTARSAAYAA